MSHGGHLPLPVSAAGAGVEGWREGPPKGERSGGVEGGGQGGGLALPRGVLDAGEAAVSRHACLICAMLHQVGVAGLLEAASLLLAEGYRPDRTLYFAFGHDEEVGGEDGAGTLGGGAPLNDLRGLSLFLDPGPPV